MISIEKSVEGNVVILAVNGNVTLTSPLASAGTTVLRAALGEVIVEAAEAEMAPRIVLDLGDCRRVDSSGIHELVRAWEAAGRLSGRLVLCRPQRQVHEVLAITKLLMVFAVYSDRRAAIASLTTV